MPNLQELIRKTSCPEPSLYDITYPAEFNGSDYTNPSDLEQAISLEFISCIQSYKVISCRRICDVIMPSILHYLSKANHIVRSKINRNHEGGDSVMYDLYLKIQQQIREADENLRWLKNWEKNLDYLIKKLIRRDWDWERNFRGTAGEAELYEELCEIDTLIREIRKQIEPPCSAKEQIRNDHALDQPSISNVSSTSKGSLDQVIPLSEIEDRYRRLDSNLQNCLLYFSAFPPDSKIRKKALIYLWIGEGFIDSESSNSEEIAATHFNELVSRGFIVPVGDKETGDFSSCKMKPSIHSGVVKLAKRFKFFHFDEKENPTINFVTSQRACLSRTEDGSLERLVQDVDHSDRDKRDKLLTLINLDETFPEFPKGWFSKVNKVRTLFLGSWERANNSPFLVENSEFLQDLCYLKLLRCLSLSRIFKIKRLPPSIAKLIQLKILDLKECYDLKEIPNSIGSLNNLTHLDISECHLIDDMPKGLSKLENLLVLKGFVISGNPNSQFQCSLADLVKLKKLRKLSIYTNRNVTGNEGQLNSLSQFQSLKILTISWIRAPRASPRAPSRVLPLGVMSSLLSLKRKMREKVEITTPGQLPAGLQKLDLRAWPLPTFPQWVDPPKLQQLKKLYIKGGGFSDLNQWMFQKSVKVLRLQYLKELKMHWGELIHQQFPNLVYFNKIDCPMLESFPADGGWRIEDGNWKPVDNTD